VIYKGLAGGSGSGYLNKYIRYLREERIMGWIAQQLQAGKKPNEVVELLVRNGWHLEDAQQAVKNAKKPPVVQKLTTRDWWVFIGALLGVLLLVLLVTFWNLLGVRPDSFIPPPISDVLIEGVVLSGVVIGAIWLFISSLYALSIKHEHPSLHRLFFLSVSGAIGLGIFSWLLFVILLALIYSKILVYTFPAILLISFLFAASIFCVEWCYRYLRNLYDAIAPRNPYRLLTVSVLVFVCGVVVLTSAAWWAQTAALQYVVDESTEMRGYLESHISTQDALDPMGLFALVGNELLRLQFEADWQSYTTMTTPLPDVSLAEVLTDGLVQNRCEAWANSLGIVASKLTVDVNLARQYVAFANETRRNLTSSDFETYRQLLENNHLYAGVSSGFVNEPVRYALTEDVAACIVRVRETTFITRVYPRDPDVNDANQRDLVAFRLWQEEQKMMT